MIVITKIYETKYKYLLDKTIDGFSEHYDFYDSRDIIFRIDNTDYYKNLKSGNYFLITYFEYFVGNFKKYLIPENVFNENTYKYMIKNYEIFENEIKINGKFFDDEFISKYHIGNFIPIDYSILEKGNICAMYYIISDPFDTD